MMIRLAVSLAGIALAAPALAFQSASAGGTQAVHDKEVFQQNKVILRQSTENNTAIKELAGTVQGALTRTRPVGRVADSGKARATVADDGETDAAISATYERIRELGCAKPDKDGAVLPAEYMDVCKKMEKSAFNMVTMLRANLARSRQRAVMIDSLLTELDRTPAGNLKETADLTARIQVETALLQNEKTMIDVAVAKNEQQMRLYSQLISALTENGPGDPKGNTFSLKRN
jgi:hypothetical protein